MRVAEAAAKLGISERSVYRLVREGLMPATVLPRDTPVLGYEIGDKIITTIKSRLTAYDNVSPASIRLILLEIKGGN